MTLKEFAEECRCCSSHERAFELLRSVDSVIAEIDRLTSIAYRMKERIEQYSAEYKQLQDKFECSEVEKKDLTEKLSRAEAEAKTLREKLEQCEIEAEELSAENDAIRLELAARERVDVLLGELNNKADAIFNGVTKLTPPVSGAELTAMSQNAKLPDSGMKPAPLVSNAEPMTISQNAELPDSGMKPVPLALDEELTAISKDAKPPDPEPKPSQKKKSAPRKASLEKSFAEFWAVYPKRKDKENAFKAWIKISPDKELFDKIMSALRVQAESEDWKKDNRQYAPYAATWLRGKRWEDELTVKDTGTSDSGMHSYDLDKLLSHAKNNIPTIKKEDGKNEDK